MTDHKRAGWPGWPRQFAGRVAVAYLAISLAWIAGSDRLVDWLAPDAASLFWINVFKGSGFVILTSVLLYEIIRRMLIRVERMREQLETHEQRLGRLAEQTSAIVWSADDQGRIRQPLASWETYTATKWPQYRNSGWLSSVHPDDRERIADSWRQSLDGQKPFEAFARLWHAKSETYRRVVIAAVPIRSVQGSVIEWVGSIDDFEDTFLAAEKLRDVRQKLDVAESRLRTLNQAIEQSPVAVVITDLSARIEFVNPAFTRITGYPESVAIGREMRILKSGKHDRQFYEELWNTIRAGRNWKGQMCNKKADGSLYWESAVISPVKVEGKVRHYVAIKEDITERRAVEEQLRQSQKMEAIGQLAGGVAHDFNNLLTVISGYTEILLNDSSLGGDSVHAAHAIQEAGRRAVALTRQLLAFSRRSVLEPRLLNPSEIVSGLLKMLGRIVGEDVEIVVELFQNTGTVLADPGQLEQAIINLVVNARDSMPGGGRLALGTSNVDWEEISGKRTVRERGAFVEIFVQDSGGGISPPTLERIFEPFFTTKSPGKGTGLGLAMVDGFVRQSGGHVFVESQLGQGSVFRLLLPRVSAKAENSQGLTRASNLPRGNETVLLVEDEAIVRALAKRVLDECGYRVLEAPNGVEAVQMALATTETIDLLITDVVMPEMGGGIVAQKVQSISPRTKVLYFSGHGAEALSRHGVQTTEKTFLAKPFSRAALASKVRQVLDGGVPDS